MTGEQQCSFKRSVRDGMGWDGKVDFQHTAPAMSVHKLRIYSGRNCLSVLMGNILYCSVTLIKSLVCKSAAPVHYRYACQQP